MIILIFDLEIVLEKCDLVREPVPLLKGLTVQFSVFYFPCFAQVLCAIFSSLSAARQDRIMGVSLTQAAIARMYSNKFSFDKEFKLVLQVIHMNIPYLLLSEGLCYNTVILPRNLVELVHSRRLQKGSVVKLTHFTASLIQNHK